MELQPFSRRLEVVDALRGFALASIIILHHVEHFDLYFHPKGEAPWLQMADKGVWNAVFWFINGKSYGIFSLLFGFTFYLQYNKQEQKGADFGWRFAWRMLILFALGIVNSAFFEGDILTFYAIIGLILIPLYKVRTTILLGFATFLLINPFAWIELANGIINPTQSAIAQESWSLFKKSSVYLSSSALVPTFIGNLTIGKAAIFYWFWETGRFMQTPALFILGLIMGRKALMMINQATKRHWLLTLKYATIFFLPLLTAKIGLNFLELSPSIFDPLHLIITSWFNLSMMMMMISLFVILWQKNWINRILKYFEPLGRMSLSNYILQSVMGAYIYYGYGLGLYQHTSATTSLLIALACIYLQIATSKQWLKAHKQGPAEHLWHKLTWVNYAGCTCWASNLFAKVYAGTKKSRNK